MRARLLVAAPPLPPHTHPPSLQAVYPRIKAGDLAAAQLEGEGEEEEQGQQQGQGQQQQAAVGGE